MTIDTKHDEKYVKLLLKPLAECAKYKPAFGKAGRENGVTVDAFAKMYGADPLYHWIGLDSTLMYAAHKAAGGMTSIYRQLGTGCERLFRAIVQDALGLSDAHVRWGYDIEKKDGTKGHLDLDARIDRSHLKTSDREPALPPPPEGCTAGATLCHEGAPWRCGPDGRWSQADRRCDRLGTEATAVVCCATPSALRPGATVHACVPSSACSPEVTP